LSVARTLTESQVHGRLRRLVETRIAHVTNDADDAHPGIGRPLRSANLQPAADRIDAGKVSPRERLVDDRRGGRVLAVALAEEAAADERRADRREVRVVDEDQRPERRALVRRQRLSLDD